MAGFSTRAFVTLDVFTDQPFAGNPLALLPDAEGLSTAQMQTITREFNLSETIFVLPPENSAHRARVRIFYPEGEMPFAGHPTLGCAIWLATQDAEQERITGDFDRLLVLEEVAGLVPVQVTRKGGAITAEFRAPVLPEILPQTAPREACAEALGLAPQDLRAESMALVQGGPVFAMVGVADVQALARARPVQPSFDRVQTSVSAMGIYVYAATGAQSWQARMFDPMGGIPEDPATGSATALFAAQLLAMGALADGETRLTLRQGVEMGRPSDLGLRIICQDGALSAVYVSGSAVEVSQGVIRVPAS